MAGTKGGSLGDLIAAARKRKGWSLRQLGEAVGKLRPDGKPLSPQFLNDIEQGRRMPSEDEMMPLLARALDLDLRLVRAAIGLLPEANSYVRSFATAGLSGAGAAAGVAIAGGAVAVGAAIPVVGVAAGLGALAAVFRLAQKTG